MLRLHARLGTTWDAEPFVARITTNAALPYELREREALLINGHPEKREGFAAVLCRSSDGSMTNGFDLALPPDLDYLAEGDIVRVVPRAGDISVLYRKSSSSNSMLLTDQCNSNCLMCSQPPKPYDDSYLVGMWLEAIPLMAR